MHIMMPLVLTMDPWLAGAIVIYPSPLTSSSTHTSDVYKNEQLGAEGSAPRWKLEPDEHCRRTPVGNRSKRSQYYWPVPTKTTRRSSLQV
jgi:hypothetical protein